MSKPELLKAATEWKMLIHKACSGGKSCTKTGKLHTTPPTSKQMVRKKTACTRRIIPSKLSTLRASRTRERPFRLIRRPAARASPIPMEVTPRPPIWMRAARMTCPKGVKDSAESTAMRPVTQTALVEVKRASVQVTVAVSRTEMGSLSSAAPSRMARAKPRAMIRAGGCFLRNWVIVFIENPLAIQKRRGFPPCWGKSRRAGAPLPRPTPDK